MIREAKQQTVKALFLGENDNNAQRIYGIPPYQREYSWQKDQWDNLFDDIDNNDKGYFIGSIICILPEDNEGKIDVIDGQQRLTTLSILLLSIYKIMNELVSSDKALKAEMFDNDDRIIDFKNLKKFFVIQGEFRLTPSIQNENKIDYEYLVDSIVNEKSDNKPKNINNRRIYKANNYFLSKIEELITNLSNPEKLDKLFELLYKVSGASVVRIDVPDVNSAFVLFESINNRGMPLTPMDLLKNIMIAQLSSNKKAEIINLEWQKIVNGINEYDNQVRYLRHFYQAFKYDDKLVNNILAVADFGSKMTKSNLLKAYAPMIRENPELSLKHLVEKSLIYKLFINPYELNNDNKLYLYKDKLMDLDRLGVSPCYTLLLYVFTKYPEHDFSHLLSVLEKWFIIRNLTNKPATSKLDNIFIHITHGQKDGYDEEKIIKELSDELPKIDFLREALEEISYQKNRFLIRYLLIYLEKLKRSLVDTKEVGQIDFWQEKNKKPIFSIEHIYPQKPKSQQDWVKCSEANLHKLGNLTLSAYNSNLSNQSFDKKCQVRDDGDKNIGLKSGNMKINDYLLDKPQWSDECINERGRALIELLLADMMIFFDKTSKVS